MNDSVLSNQGKFNGYFKLPKQNILRYEHYKLFEWSNPGKFEYVESYPI